MTEHQFIEVCAFVEKCMSKNPNIKFVDIFKLAKKQGIINKLDEPEIQQEIQKGIPCLFWDNDDNYKTFGLYGKTNEYKRHYALSENWWDNCEPCWPAIFILCDIPNEYNWISCDDNGEWFAYEKRPEKSKFRDCWFITDGEMITLKFIPHPDPANSLYSRDDIPECLR